MWSRSDLDRLFERDEFEFFGMEIDFGYSDPPVGVLLDEEFGDVRWRWYRFIAFVKIWAMQGHDDGSVFTEGTI